MTAVSLSEKAARNQPVLALRGITKRFGALAANDDISLELGRGEVLGLLGENGAGKSTLMNVLSGLIRADAGELVIDGQPVHIASPRDAGELGIGMVHQHFMIVPTLTVAENIALGDRGLRPAPIDLRAVRRKIAALAETLGFSIDADAIVGELSVGEQQRVEIIKALCRDARILILDEPTAILTRDQADKLFDAVRSLVATGLSVILISHRLDDVFAICNRVAVLRRGRKVLETRTDETDHEALILAMVGEAVTPPAGARAEALGATLLSVSDLTLRRSNGSTAVRDVSFDVRGGEILAVAGVEGNGQSELAETIAGLRPIDEGQIVFDGQPSSPRGDPMALRRLGLRHVAEDRHATSVLSAKPLRDNYLLSLLHAGRLNRRGWLRRGVAHHETEATIDRFDVQAPGALAVMAALSGGNQQKMVLGRELAEGLRFLVAVHPTRGLDVRTIAYIQEQMLTLRDSGVGILLVSADLNEIWRLADRILVLGGGVAHGPVSLSDTSVQQVGAWMAGHA